MRTFALKTLITGLPCLFLFITLPVMAGTAAFTEGNRRMVEACVDPQIAGVTAVRKKDGEPKSHTLTFQFSANYQQASVIAGTRVAKTADCTAIFNLATGLVTGEVSIGGDVHDYILQFTSGLSFNVVAFPLPVVVEGAQTSLWRVTNGSNEVFVGGVVNYSMADFWTAAFGFEGVDILRTADFPLPAGFEEAYDMADVILTRTAPSQFNAALLTLNGLTISPLTNITNSLNADVYGELEEYMNIILNDFGVNIGNLGAFRPHWVADLMRYLSATYVAGYIPGVESYFQAKAVSDGKVNFGLEEADEAMFTLNINMLNADSNALITDALADVKSDDFIPSIEALLNAWRTGDDDYLDDVLVEPDRQGELADFTRFYTDRYVIWLNAFDDMLESAQQEFVLMDVRYLVGVDSFLVALEEAGYTVTRY
jgi:hypothetical protein